MDDGQVADALAAESYYRTLVEGISDYAVFMLDPSGRVCTWNTGARRFKGYLDTEIIGQHFSRFYTPDDQRAGLPGQALEAARRDGRFEMEGWRVRKDGTRFWAHVIIDAIRDKKGALVGFAKVTRDLTERVLAEKRLRKTEEQFRLLVQGVTDYAIFMLDPDGCVASWNSGAEHIKGYRADEILGQHFSRFYTEEDRQAHVPDRALETVTREGRVEMEGWRVRKDGSRFWAHVVIEAILNDEGKLVGFAKITRDNTERRQAQQVMESFAYSVSHDLRAPLRGIEGFARILLEDYGEKLGAGGRRYAERIVAAADRLQLLISDLLTFSRLQRAEIKLKQLEIGRIVRRQREQAQGQAGPEGALIEIVEPLARVCAEPTVFEQALSNLLSNAVKYRRPGEPARVRVWTEGKGDRVRVLVEDQGIGIAPEHYDRIFGAFERLHGQENYPGSGMGLAIVKTGIERMGGTVGVVSKLGKGTTFWIELASGDHACADT